MLGIYNMLGWFGVGVVGDGLAVSSQTVDPIIGTHYYLCLGQLSKLCH
jgi:hypothetical protein